MNHRASDFIQIEETPSGASARLHGAWTKDNARQIAEEIGGHAAPAAIDASGLAALDTYGACLLHQLGGTTGLAAPPITGLGARERMVAAVGRAMAGLSAAAQGLKVTGRPYVAPGYPDLFVRFLSLTGAFGLALLRCLLKPKRFRFAAFFHQLDLVGVQALPIITLVTFLIGAIIAQQGIFHFRKFGAGDYVVDLVGILVLREIGVLIVAIMVAGRSGSAYTAEIGAMKMREEIDALRVMLLDPVDVLVVPRLCALIVALPLLTFIGIISALVGGGMVAWLYGGMAPQIFIVRLQEAISLTHLKVGMLKAPFMAFAIGIVACVEGFRVGGSTESLGRQTTASVVEGIFLVIVFDGLFAVFFASIGM